MSDLGLMTWRIERGVNEEWDEEGHGSWEWRGFGDVMVFVRDCCRRQSCGARECRFL